MFLSYQTRPARENRAGNGLQEETIILSMAYPAFIKHKRYDVAPETAIGLDDTSLLPPRFFRCAAMISMAGINLRHHDRHVRGGAVRRIIGYTASPWRHIPLRSPDGFFSISTAENITNGICPAPVT
jgi:hypothetical protein